VLSLGGCSVTLTARRFDVVEMFDAIERERVNQIAIVGDAFGKPMLKALDDNPGRWDLASLFLVASSGVMFSEQVKQGLLEHHPGMMLVDVFSSSEAVGMGQSISSGGTASSTAQFRLGENTIVVTEDGRRVEPGSGEIGRVAVGGHQPLGYYKDPDKTTATFIEIEGRRYSCPGDYAVVEADGSLTLLGRGSVVINTGGEKVYPEEVEAALKSHPGVFDALVVGVPDDRFGQRVAAVVQARDGFDLTLDDLAAHCRTSIAGYKVPRELRLVPAIGRTASGKADYKWAKAQF
jgi:acyl-CoA synthetase (AMP-forming)/AMP-acid ligase II